MAGKSTFGCSVSMSNEFNFKGKRTEVKSKGKACTPVKMSDLTPPVDVGAFVPFLMGAVPVCSGTRELSSCEQAVMGALSVAGSIQITQDPETAKYMFNYILSLLKVVDGASAKNGKLSEDELKKLLMSLMSKWLEESGPGFASYKEVLMDLMQKATLQDFMKGMQNAVCAMVGDPVNANTGNFIYEKEDLVIKGRIPLCFQRFYNSTDKRTGVMGNGWRHNYEIRLLVEKDRYTILWGDGGEEVYLGDRENGPQPLFGQPCRLRREKDNYLYETQEKLTYTFDVKGKLKAQTDLNGQGFFFTYDNKGRLNSIQSSSGTSLNYGYDSFCGLLCSVTDHTGRSVTLTYELGRLKEVKNPSGQSYLYTYSPDKKISKIRNPRGVYVLENSYDDKGRTTVQRFADGGKIRYDYQDDLSRTLVTEQNGNKVAYVHDERFRNIKTLYIDGEETFRYNDKNQLTAKTDKKGNKTKFSYDDKGNIAQIIYPDGAKHNMTYDACNRLLTLSVNGKGKLKNTYDAKGNLIQTTDALDRYRQIAYDENGNPVNIKQPDGSQLLLEYDKRGNITQLTDGAGNHTAYEYDACNRVIRTTDGNGNSTGFAYDGRNQITCVTNAAGASRTYEYTKNGKVAKVRDFNGAVTSQEYNNMNQVKSFTLPDSGITQMEYDLMQNVTRRTLPNGAEIKYVYDKLNRLEQAALPTGGKIRCEYDPNGNRTAQIDPNGNRTTMEYDERNRLTRKTDPSGASTEYEYDMEGHLTGITNAAGKTHTYTYDEAGQVISETDISGNTTRYDYNELGNIACVTDAKKRKTLYEYAPGGSLLKISYPDGTFETFSYDKNHNVIRQQNQKGDFLAYTYDCMNRVTAVKSSFGQEKSCTYNAAGNRTLETDALGHKTHYTYSPGGKLISVVDAAGNRTEYAYDSMGGLITICQHGGTDKLLKEDGRVSLSATQDRSQVHVTQYKRNLLGKVETITDPLGLQEHYSYDLAGQMILKKDKEGYETRYAYNPAGDVENITYGDGRSVAYTYNPLRQLIEIRDWLGTTRIEPDHMGRAKKVTDHKGREIAYQWGSMGEREAIIYPDGRKVSYEYDRLSRLSRLRDGVREIQYSYNEEGRLSEKVYPDGITSSYQYNAMGLLGGLTHRKDGEILERYQYGYDPMGNKTEVRKKRASSYMPKPADGALERKLQEESGYYQYQYDSLNRLTQVRKGGESLSRYEYDAFSNRTRKSTESENIRYYYNAANQLIRSEGALPVEAYQYDPRGNMAAVLKGEKIVNRYIYDATNRLAYASNAKGQAVDYQYDGLGNRVGMREYIADGTEFGSAGKNAIQRELLPDGNPAKEVDYLLDLTKQYHNLLEKTETADGMASSQDYIWDTNAVFMTEGGNAHIYLQDELGSTVRLVGMGKAQQTVYGYDEFGQDLYGTQGEIQPFGYTGYRKDNIANTYFAQAREYLPDIGRFSGEDINKGYGNMPLSLNLYTYAYSNPLVYVDLDGNTPTDIFNTGMSTAGVVALMDSPAPGPMDVVAAIIVGGTLLVAGGVAVYDWAIAKDRAKEEEKEKSAAISISQEPTDIVIYRKGSGNPTNLTPREQDIGGLSYQLTLPQAPYSMTTIGVVNSTQVLHAEIDGTNHVSVYPVRPGEIQTWISTRPKAKENPYYLTTLLASISVKHNGKPCLIAD